MTIGCRQRRTLNLLGISFIIISLAFLGPVSAGKSKDWSVTTPAFFICGDSTNPEWVTTLTWPLPITSCSAGPPASLGGCLTPVTVPCIGLWTSLTNAFSWNNRPCLDEQWGSAWVPPDPFVGGKVLVGGGSTGTVTVVTNGGTTTVTISSANPCTPGVSVTTTYRFFNTAGPSVNKFFVTRMFTFTSAMSFNVLRPYIPRLFPRGPWAPSGITHGFSEVWFPTTGTGNPLGMQLSTNCDFGGPPQGSASCLIPSTTWVQSGPLSYYVIRDAASTPSTALRGVIVTHQSSTSSVTGPIPVGLWVDNDFGSFTTDPSVLLNNPANFGSSGTETVREAETFCFYSLATTGGATFDATLGVGNAASSTLPAGC